MKMTFSGPVNSQDTVILSLYKRVFPKWTYDPLVSAPPALYNPERPKQALDTVAEVSDEEAMVD